MARRQNNMVVEIALTLAVALVAQVAAQNPSAQCEEGWTYFRETNGNNNGMCYMAVQTPLDAPGARRFCQERVSHLVNLDRLDQFSYFGPNEQQKTVPQFILDNFPDFWSGMRIEEDMRLMWDAYGPKFVKRQKFSFGLPWNWVSGQPVYEMNTCGHVILGSREQNLDPTNLEVTPGTLARIFNGAMDVEMLPCEKELPFVCEKPAIRKDIQPTSQCPEGWIGHPYLTYCLRYVNETETYEAAKRRCSNLGGALMTVNDDSFSSFDLRVVEEAFYYFDRFPNPLFAKDFWVQSTKPLRSEVGNPCPVVTFASEVAQIVPRACVEGAFFMCTRPILRNAGKPNIQVTSPYLAQHSLMEFPKWFYLPVSAEFDRHPADNEIVFVKTPTTYLNSSGFFRPWTFQNPEYDVRYTRETSLPYYVNVTLPNRPQSPQRKRRSLMDDHAGYVADFASPERKARAITDGNFIDINDVAQTCGYYSFGTFRIFPADYIESPPVLIRYSERDLYIYVATVKLADWIISSSTNPEEQTGAITVQDVILRKLLEDDSYTVNLQEYVGGALNSLNIEEVDVQYYRGVIEDVSSNPNIMKLRLFLSIFNSRAISGDFEQLMVPVLEQSLRSRLGGGDAFDRKSVRVKSTVSCPAISRYDDERETTGTFPITRVGEKAYSWERCYGGNGALASATCEGGYDHGTSWSRIVFNAGCQKFPELEESSSTNDLKNMSETVITNENVDVILKDTANLTLPNRNLTEADIIYTAEILYNYWQFGSIAPIALDDVFDVLNNAIQALPDAIAQAQQLNNAANRIIRSVDELTGDFQLTTPGTKTIVRSFVASAVRLQTGRGDLIIGLELENSSSSTGDQITPDALLSIESPANVSDDTTDTAIYLSEDSVRELENSSSTDDQITTDALLSIESPADVSADRTDTAIYLSEDSVRGAVTRLSFHIYSKTELFATPQGRFVVNSKVAAARMVRNNQPVVDLGDERVTVVFEISEESEHIMCGWWDYFANEDAGGWKTAGCELSRKGNKVTCKCDHLTNFAVLIDLRASDISDTHKYILAIVTKVGLSISIIALGLTILTFLVFKHLRNGRGQQVLINLSVSMICSAIIFLVGMDRTENKIGCKVVAALLHYFILVSFAWMLVEGLLQYLRFVKVLGTYIPKFMLKSMIPAWGIPLIPVIIVLGIDHDLYYGGHGYCWMDTDAMLYAFIIPVAAVIFANIIVFFLVLCNICRRRNKGMKTNQSERKMAFLHFQAAVSIFVILGLTWIFGFLAVDGAQLAFHYIFAILNALQGLFIFLLFTAREKQIRKAWKKMCCPKSQYKSTTSSGTDNTNTRKHSTDNTGSKVTSSAGVSGRDETVHFNNPQFNRN